MVGLQLGRLSLSPSEKTSTSWLHIYEKVGQHISLEALIKGRKDEVVEKKCLREDHIVPHQSIKLKAIEEDLP